MKFVSVMEDEKPGQFEEVVRGKWVSVANMKDVGEDAQGIKYEEHPDSI